MPPVPYRTVTRRLRVFAKDSWRQQISAACAAHAGLGPASLVLYDCSTLYFETDEGDGFRESGFSEERRLEPQITIGLLTDQYGFPLMVSAFEGNRAETKMVLPVIEAFMAAHGLPDVTVVADAGMVSEANQKAIEAAGLSFILGARIPHEPYVVKRWRREHPGAQVPDGHVFVQPWPAGPTGGRRDQVIYYQYKADRARRALRGIDEQVAREEQAVAGQAPVKRNRFIQLAGGTKSVNRELEAKARALAGLKSYVTNLRACPDGTPVTAEFVIGAYHQLFQIEKSFRMAKSDLQARPVYHRTRDSIEAHLTTVFAALAVSRWVEHVTGYSIRKFVKPPADTAPSRSRPATTSSPPPTRYPTTCAWPSTRSTPAADLRTSLAEVRLKRRAERRIFVSLRGRAPSPHRIPITPIRVPAQLTIGQRAGVAGAMVIAARDPFGRL